jgi:hypothetical protein
MSRAVKEMAFYGAALGAVWGGCVLLLSPAGRTMSYLPDAIAYAAIGAAVGAGAGVVKGLIFRS